MTKSGITSAPFLRGKSGSSNIKAWRGKAGWKEAQALKTKFKKGKKKVSKKKLSTGKKPGWRAEDSKGFAGFTLPKARARAGAGSKFKELKQPAVDAALIGGAGVGGWELGKKTSEKMKAAAKPITKKGWGKAYKRGG